MDNTRFNGLPLLEDYLGWRETTRDGKVPTGHIGALQGGLLDIMNLSPSDVRGSDISRGLAAISRYNGQTDLSAWGGKRGRSWTVADHSVCAFEFAKKLSPILGLSQERTNLYAACTALHDSPEYIIGDLVTPLKALLKPFITRVEDGILRSIHIAFGLPESVDDEMATLVKLADDAMLLLESVAIRPGFEHYEMRITDQSRWLLRSIALSHPDKIEDLLTINPSLDVDPEAKMNAALDEIMTYPDMSQKVVNISDIVSPGDIADNEIAPTMGL